MDAAGGVGVSFEGDGRKKGGTLNLLGHAALVTRLTALRGTRADAARDTCRRRVCVENSEIASITRAMRIASRSTSPSSTA